jgi:hypothetical protein
MLESFPRTSGQGGGVGNLTNAERRNNVPFSLLTMCLPHS